MEHHLAFRNSNVSFLRLVAMTMRLLVNADEVRMRLCY
jgi:hypothetical protein